MNEKKVIALTRNHLPIGETPLPVVKLLEKLVAQAERGELLGMAVAWVEGPNNIIFQIVEGVAPSSSMVAAVAALDFEIKSRWAGK